jgi:hypothetical protein
VRGLVLAAGAFALLVLASAVMLRVYPGNKEFKVFLGAFAGSVVLYAVGFWLLPADLGFIPLAWQESSLAVDLGNGLLMLVLVFRP